MTKTYQALYWVNLVGAIAYLLVCGVFLWRKQPLYTGQGMLMAQVASGIVFASAPAIIERLGHFRFPLLIKVIWEAFILGSVLLGTGMQFYEIPYWDKFLHLFSASMLGGLGLAVFGALTPKSQLEVVDARLLGVFATTFGTTIGVFWEFYEFTFDGLLGLNMQRFMVGTTPLVGRAALMDTMGDLFADVLGAAALGIWCAISVRRNRARLTTFLFEKQ